MGNSRLLHTRHTKRPDTEFHHFRKTLHLNATHVRVTIWGAAAHVGSGRNRLFLNSKCPHTRLGARIRVARIHFRIGGWN